MTTVYLVGLLSLSVALIVWLAQRWGGVMADRDFAERGNKHAKRSNKIDEAVDGMSHGDLDHRLRGDQ